MKKKTFALLLALCMLFMLVACGGSVSNPSSAAPAQTSSGSTAASTGGTDAAGEPELVLKLGHALSEQLVLHEAMVSYAEKVYERSNGRIRIDVYANAQLGNERDMVEGMQLGTIDIVYAATSVVANFVPSLSIFDGPFLFRDADHLFKVCDGDIGKGLTDEIKETQNLITLGFMDTGARHIFSTKPVRTMDDFSGLKIRTMENELQTTLFNTLGAQATPMAFGEVYTALQQGTIDAGEQPLQGITGSGFDEICKYVSLSGHVYSPNLFLLGGASYDKIPDDLKEMVLEEGWNACLLQRQLVGDANDGALDQLIANDVEIITLDHEELMAKAQPVYEQFSNLLDPDLVEQIKAIQ